MGEGLYNFGELLEHPVVTTPEETEFAWLAELLRAFNAGDIAQYEALVGQHHAELHQQPALLANTTFSRRRSRPRAPRRCSSSVSARRASAPSPSTRLPLRPICRWTRSSCSSCVRSRSLIRGLLDEVDRTLRVTWVQPRVFGSSQINLMKERLQTWCGTVNKTLSSSRTRRPSSPKVGGGVEEGKGNGIGLQRRPTCTRRPRRRARPDREPAAGLLRRACGAEAVRVRVERSA